MAGSFQRIRPLFIDTVAIVFIKTYFYKNQIFTLKEVLSDKEILESYKEAFERYTRNSIVDMDKLLKHKLGFVVQRLEKIVKTLNGFVPPNRQSVYYITFFKEGRGEKSIGAHHFPIAKNTLFVIPKRTIHSSQYQSSVCSGYILNFNIDFFLNNAFPRKHIIEKKIFTAALKPWLVVNDEQRKQLETIFEYIISENQKQKPEKQVMIAVKILELLIICDRFFSAANAIGKTSVYHPKVAAFDQLIEEHFRKNRSVEFYATALHIHPDYLNVLLKQYNGTTAKKTIDNRVLLEAQSLLASTSRSVKEIAYDLGFEDANYFSTFFQKMTEQSPKEYRADLFHNKTS